jgi:Protein of unknown function (DUF3263)
VGGWLAPPSYPSLPSVDTPAPRSALDGGDMARDFAAALEGVQVDAAAIIAETTLSEHQQAILDFERRWWSKPGAKEQAIRDSFEMSPTRYYQTLNALIDLPQAVSYDPVLVNRLRRVRTAAPRARRLS